MTAEDAVSGVNSIEFSVNGEHYIVVLDQNGEPVAASRREMVRFGVRRPHERLRRMRGEKFNAIRDVYREEKARIG